MIAIKTRDFGVRRVNEVDIIFFVEAVLGFEAYRRYILIEADRTWPFNWLQSATEPGLAFPVVDAALFETEYTDVLNHKSAASLLAGLAVEDPSELRMLTLAVITPELENMRVNLRAPIALNPRRALAKQLVLADASYPMQFYFAREATSPFCEMAHAAV